MLEALLTRYGLEGWRITLQSVPASDLPKNRAADVDVFASERAALIRIADDVPEALWMIVLEHEVRHVWLWRWDDLRDKLCAALPEHREMLIFAFGIVNEQSVGDLEALQKRNPPA